MSATARPEWQRLCEFAILELDPIKRLERITTARHAILDLIEEGHSKTPIEQTAMRQALATLDALRSMVERRNTD